MYVQRLNPFKRRIRECSNIFTVFLQLKKTSEEPMEQSEDGYLAEKERLQLHERARNAAYLTVVEEIGGELYGASYREAFETALSGFGGVPG